MGDWWSHELNPDGSNRSRKGPFSQRTIGLNSLFPQ